MKVVLDDIPSGYNLSKINENFGKIETALNEEVLYRNNPIGEPNQMGSDLDMNGKIIYNLPEPTLEHQAARLQDVQNAISGVSTANLVAYTPTGSISANTVQGAINELDVEKVSTDDLANAADPSKGASLVGGGAQVVASVDALRALLKTSPSSKAFVTGYYADGDGGGGLYYLDLTDTTSTDNGSTVIVAADGGRWKLASQGRVSAKQMGAKGDNVTNDYTPLQTMFSNGKVGYSIPAGTYSFGTGLVVDYSPVSPAFPIPGTPSKRVDIRGESIGNTILAYSGTGYAINMFGTDATGAGQGIHSIDMIGGFTLQDKSFTKANHGIYMQNRAYWKIQDVFLQYFGNAMEIQSSFTGKVENCYMNYSTIGLKLTTNELGAINAISVDRCTFSGNSLAGTLGVAIGSSTLFSVCTFEDNGTMGDMGSGGFIANVGAYGYSGPLAFESCYFEVNKGNADIYIDNVTTKDLTVSISNCIFNRASDVNYTQNNISVSSSGGGRVTVLLKGNNFISAGTYVPSADRPFLLGSSQVHFVDLGGNTYQETTSLTAPYASGLVTSGKISGAGAIIMASPSISCTKLSTGVYRISSSVPFGKTTDFYTVTATSNDSSGTTQVRSIIPQSGSIFDVTVVNSSFTATDGAFSFNVLHLGG